MVGEHEGLVALDRVAGVLHRDHLGVGLALDAEVITVQDAGHSIPGDQPLVLADHLDRLLDR